MQQIQSESYREYFPLQIKLCLQVCECVQVGAKVMGRGWGVFSNTDNISSVLPLSLLIPR